MRLVFPQRLHTINLEISSERFNEIIYLFSIFVYVFTSVLRQSFFLQYIPDSVYKLLIIFCFGIMFISEIVRYGIKHREVLGIGICMVLALIMYQRSYSVLPLFIFILCARNIKFDLIAKYVSAAIFISIAIVVLSSYAGIIHAHVTRTFEDNGLRVRHFLGFRYALVPSSLLYNAIALHLFAYRDTLSIARFAGVFLISYWIFAMTDSRLNFYLTAAMILLLYIIYRFPKILNKIRTTTAIMALSFPLSMVLSFGLTLYYGLHRTDARIVNLNQILEERLRLGYEAFQTYPINLFGSQIVFVGNGLTADGKKIPGRYNYVDSFYENVLLRYGILFFIAMLVLFTITMFWLRKRKQYDLLMITTLVAVHGIVDDSIINLQSNAFWLLIGICLFSGKRNVFSDEGYTNLKRLLYKRRKKKRKIELVV